MAVHYSTGLDIYNDVIDRLPLASGETHERAKRSVNRAYYDLLMIVEWPWAKAKRPGICNLKDSISDTVTVTKGSASATVTTLPTTQSLVDWKLVHDVNQKEYRILTHVLTAITFDATWLEDSCTVEACTIYNDEFTLATDCLLPWSFYDRTYNKKIEFPYPKEDRETGSLTGYYIDHASILTNTLDATFANIVVINFRPLTEYARAIEYSYTKIPTHGAVNYLSINGTTSTDTPLVPIMDRHVLADMALRIMLKDFRQDANAMAKVTTLSIEIKEKLTAMKNFWINTGGSNSLSA